MPYTPPGTPTARARRRRGDLQDQQRRKIRQARRRDRRREAFRVMRQRIKIVKDYRARRHAGLPEYEAAHHTAERFACSTRSVRRFARAWRTGGKAALMPHFQVPPPPPPTLSWTVIATVLALRVHLGWCGQRIAAELDQRGIARISHTRVYRLFRRYHVPVRTYHPVGRRDGIRANEFARYRRQRVRAPNWTWHLDFAGPWADADGVKRSLVIVVDSYSRMLLSLDVVEHQSSEAVEAVLARLFEQYGRPRVLITDNAATRRGGRAFAPVEEGYAHRFARFLAGYGVEHRRTKPYYPQTNGKAEAMVKTAKREFIARLGAHWTWSAAEEHAAAFMGWYNFYRAHAALGYEVPASCYGGVRLAKRGLEHIFGLWEAVSEAAISVECLPVLTKESRMRGLSLAVAA